MKSYFNKLTNDKIVGCHFDPFAYIEIGQAAAKKTFAEKGKELISLEVGEMREVSVEGSR